MPLNFGESAFVLTTGNEGGELCAERRTIKKAVGTVSYMPEKRQPLQLPPEMETQGLRVFSFLPDSEVLGT